MKKVILKQAATPYTGADFNPLILFYFQFCNVVKVITTIYEEFLIQIWFKKTKHVSIFLAN
jgi:hypothetical protein